MICSVCLDTHQMRLSRDGHEDRVVMCTACPVPCQRCRAGAVGAFCGQTPCACECHIKKPFGARTPDEVRVYQVEEAAVDREVAEHLLSRVTALETERGVLDERLYIASEAYANMKTERDLALAVVRAVYQESTAIHAAYRSLPEVLRREVETSS